MLLLLTLDIPHAPQLPTQALALVFLSCAYLRVKFNVSAAEVADLSTSAVTAGVDKEKKVRPLEGLGWMPQEWGWQPIGDTVEPDAVASSFVLVSWKHVEGGMSDCLSVFFLSFNSWLACARVRQSRRFYCKPQSS